MSEKLNLGFGWRAPTPQDKSSGCPDCGCDIGHKHGVCSNPKCPLPKGLKCRTYDQLGMKVDEDQ